MIDKTLTFLKGQVNKHLKTLYPTLEDKVVLSNIVDLDQSDTVGLPENRVVLSLIYIEEERLYKAQETFHRATDGNLVQARPELRFNLYVLFAAHFNNNNYGEALKFLSQILKYFQGNPVFDAQSNPSLDPEIKRLVVELYTQPMDQQSQLWQALGGKFLPSIMYKLRLLSINSKESQGNLDPIGSMGISPNIN